MKVCPRCRRTYTDESLKFCRDDGATLVSAPASGETATRTLDARDEEHLVPISTCPLPPVDAFKDRGGRFGAHNIHENTPVPTAFKSDQIVLGTFFNGGLRAYDISNPYQPKEIATFVPPAPANSPVGAVQLNDVYVDERGIVYAVDRFSGGLYTLEMDF